MGSTPQLILKNPNATLPDILKQLNFRCEAFCYNPAFKDKLLKHAVNCKLYRVTVNKANAEKTKLFSSRQSFYVGSSSKFDRVLDSIIDEHKIPSTRIGIPSQFDWNDYYNIEVEYKPGEVELLEFHKIADVY